MLLKSRLFLLYRYCSLLYSSEINKRLKSKCRMLHEFHRKQNLKQPDSVHATYLLTGYRPLPQVTPETANNGEGDIPMEWSPFNATQKSRQSSEVPVKTILVVPQEELEGKHSNSYQLTEERGLKKPSQSRNRNSNGYAAYTSTALSLRG
jgi:hypothetical protein